MYKLPEHLLVNNPIKRYLINSPMFAGVEKDPDGGLTIYMQKIPRGPTKSAISYRRQMPLFLSLSPVLAK
jgi:hypothetical protein